MPEEYTLTIMTDCCTLSQMVMITPSDDCARVVQFLSLMEIRGMMFLQYHLMIVQKWGHSIIQLAQAEMDFILQRLIFQLVGRL